MSLSVSTGRRFATRAISDTNAISILASVRPPLPFTIPTHMECLLSNAVGTECARLRVAAFAHSIIGGTAAQFMRGLSVWVDLMPIFQ